VEMATYSTLWCCVGLLMFSSRTTAEILPTCVADNPPTPATAVVLLDTNHYTRLPWTVFSNVSL